MQRFKIGRAIFIMLALSSSAGISACSGDDPDSAAPQNVVGENDALVVEASAGTTDTVGVRFWGLTITDGRIEVTGYDSAHQIAARAYYAVQPESDEQTTTEFGVTFPERARGSLRMKQVEDRIEGVNAFAEGSLGLTIIELLQQDITSANLEDVDGPGQRSQTAGSLPGLTPQQAPVPGSSSPVPGTSTPVNRSRGLCLINAAGRGCGGKVLLTVGSCGASVIACISALAGTGGSATCTIATAGGCSFTIPVAALVNAACGASALGCLGNALDTHDQGCRISTNCP
jgi:hypothetical protein